MSTTTILSLPFTYAVRAVLPRRRNEQAFEVKDWLPVEVREVGEDEAPIAIRVDGVGGEMVYRVHEGALYVPVGVSTSEFGRDVARPAGEWRSRHRRREGSEPGPSWDPEGLPRLPSAVASYGKGVPPMSCPTLTELCEEHSGEGRLRVRGDDRAARQAQASDELSRGLLLVDGEVWTTRHAWEPHYEVVEANGKVTVGLSLAVERLAYVHGFRLDKGGDAMSFASERVRLHSGAGVEWDLVDERRQVEILVPEALLHDQAVMIAGQVLSCLGPRITNRVEVEPWGEEADGLDARLRDFAGRARALTVDEAAEVISTAARLRDLLHDVDGHYAVSFVTRAEPGLTRWLSHEAPSRRDLPDWDDFEGIRAGDVVALSSL